MATHTCRKGFGGAEDGNTTMWVEVRWARSIIWVTGMGWWGWFAAARARRRVTMVESQVSADGGHHRAST